METLQKLMEQLEVAEADADEPSLSSSPSPFQPEDIECLFMVSKKEKNDSSNKKREQILAEILTKGEEHFQHETYGSKWKMVQEKWRSLLESLCQEEYHTIEVSTKAGRAHHYDFLVKYKGDGGATVAEKKLEFKHNCSKIGKLPQFLSLPVKQEFLEESYAEFYYQHYLPKYIQCDRGITCEPPPLEKYLKLVNGSKYDTHPFFRELYNRETFSRKEKDAIVKESIHVFLQKMAPRMNLEKLTEKLEGTQDGKIFILWDKQNFHVETFGKEDLTIQGNEGIKNKNSILVRSATHVFQLLLRWRNHKGILYPAWQISLRS